MCWLNIESAQPVRRSHLINLRALFWYCNHCKGSVIAQEENYCLFSLRRVFLVNVLVVVVYVCVNSATQDHVPRKPDGFWIGGTDHTNLRGHRWPHPQHHLELRSPCLHREWAGAEVEGSGVSGQKAWY